MMRVIWSWDLQALSASSVYAFVLPFLGTSFANCVWTLIGGGTSNHLNSKDQNCCCSLHPEDRYSCIYNTTCGWMWNFRILLLTHFMIWKVFECVIWGYFLCQLLMIFKSVCGLKHLASWGPPLPVCVGTQPPWNSHLLGKPHSSKYSFLRRKREPDEIHYSTLESSSRQSSSCVCPNSSQRNFHI